MISSGKKVGKRPRQRKCGGHSGEGKREEGKKMKNWGTVVSVTRF
jgi:hypothetical protein